MCDEYVLSPAEYKATLEKIERINARAAKRGFTGRFEFAGVSELVTDRTEGGLTTERTMYRCTLTGEAPSYEGWEFLARLDLLESEDGSPLWLVSTAPGVEESGVDRDELRPGACDHCGTVRRNRRKLMLVRNVAGDIKQVGTTCLKDFLGWSGAPVWIDPKTVSDDLEAGFGVGAPAEFTPRTVLAAAIASVAEYGWSPASADGIPTKVRVHAVLSGTDHPDRIAGIAEHFPAAEVTVDAELTEARRLTSLEASDYGRNLHVALNAAAVGPRQFALVCSVVSYLARSRQQAAEKAIADQFTPEWAGEMGERITVTGEVTTCMLVDGYMPDTTQVLVVITTEQAQVKFVTSAQWAYADDFDRGITVTVTGTIKKLDEYRGKKQTILTRLKLVV